MILRSKPNRSQPSTSCCHSKCRCRSRTSRSSVVKKGRLLSRGSKTISSGSSGTIRRGSWDAGSAAASIRSPRPRLTPHNSPHSKPHELRSPPCRSVTPQVRDSPLPTVVTVAEVAVRLAEHNENAVNRALDEAIEFIAGIQRTYGALASEPMAIMTRARLPLLVPHVVREVISGAHPSDWPDMPGLDVVFPRAPRLAEYMPAPSAEWPRGALVGGSRRRHEGRFSTGRSAMSTRVGETRWSRSVKGTSL